MISQTLHLGSVDIIDFNLIARQVFNVLAHKNTIKISAIPYQHIRHTERYP